MKRMITRILLITFLSMFVISCVGTIEVLAGTQSSLLKIIK